MTGTTRSIRRALVGLPLAVILGAPPISAATGAGGDSPQEVFEEALAANRQSDMATLLSLVAPEERGRVLLDLFDMAASACTQSPEQVAPLCALLEESGLAERIPAALEGAEAEAELRFEPRMAHQRERASAIFAGVDVPAFGQRLMEVLLELGAPDGDLFTWERLDSLEVDGDRAVAREDGRSDELRFVEVDGRWYLSWRALM